MAITQIAKGRSLLKKYVISELSGEVVGQDTSSQTEVTGKIYGGGTTSVTGGISTNSPVQGKIESETTTFQTLYLQDDDGVERVVELVNMRVPNRSGHRITVWQLANGMCVRADNHNTQETYYNDAISSLMFPKIFYFIFGTVFASWAMSDATTDGMEFGIFWFMYLLVGLAVAVIPSKIIAWYRIHAVKKAIKKNSIALAS
jgi:hypothetical protein